MEVRVNGLKNCDTCRKALRELRDAGWDVDFRDLRENPPTAGELGKWWKDLGGALLNTRSTTWRALDESARQSDPQVLMSEHPTLIKRPVLETADQLLLGWTPQTRTALGI